MAQIATTEMTHSRFVHAYAGEKGREAVKPGFFTRLWERLQAAQMEKAERYLAIHHPRLARQCADARSQEVQQ
jgi:hypothetical protein